MIITPKMLADLEAARASAAHQYAEEIQREREHARERRVAFFNFPPVAISAVRPPIA